MIWLQEKLSKYHKSKVSENMKFTTALKYTILLINQRLGFLEIPYVLTWVHNDVYTSLGEFNAAGVSGTGTWVACASVGTIIYV